MKRLLVALALSIAFGPAFAQTPGSAIPADKQQVQKDKAQIRAERQKAKRDKQNLAAEKRKARAAAAKG
jgi:hypothetical protein